MGPVGFSVSISRSTLWDDTKAAVRSFVGTFKHTEADALAHHYAMGYFKRALMFVPSQVFFYARILLLVTIGKVSQLAQSRSWVCWTKQQINAEAIRFACYSMEHNIYQVGWLSPRIVLGAHFVLRLSTRVSLAFNDVMTLVRPCGSYMQGESLINRRMVFASMKATVRLFVRYCELVSASIALAAARGLGADALKDHLLEIIHHVSFLAKDKVDISRYQLAIAWKWVGSDAVSALLHIPIKMTSWVANRFL